MTSSVRILIVDSDESSFKMLQSHLVGLGYAVSFAENGESALSQLAEQRADLVISDLVLPDMQGAQLMKAAKKLYQRLHFIIYTASGSIESAVSAMRLGALDYLEKPFNAKTFHEVLQRTIEQGRLTNDNAQLQENYRKRFSFHNIVTQSPIMQQTLDLATRVAASPLTTISLTGESGSGKEVLARAIHFESGCLPSSFVAVNCASIPDSLLESELFGHIRGAFTGAEKEREGKFSMAQGGTVLLDEIGDMPLHLQAKLLRVLEERIYEKIGSNTPIQAEFRIIAATHRNLTEMVEQGTFREDLFHRINVVPIAIPPLRERKEDIPVLVDLFLDLFRKHQGKSIPGVSKKAMDMLLSYSWPGNVRELRNMLEYATIMISDELIRPEHLRFTTSHSPSSPGSSNSTGFQINLSSEELSLDSVIKRVLNIALERCGGNKTKAAELLKVNRKMFYT